jgi:quercetin dioxygenase-like cupin family protein
MAFDLNDELNSLMGESAWQRNGHNARTLAKYPDLRIVLAAAQRGARIKTHEPNERIAVQVLRGRIRFGVGDRVIEAGEGQLVTVDKSMAHEIEAIEESAFLLHVSAPLKSNPGA